MGCVGILRFGSFFVFLGFGVFLCFVVIFLMGGGGAALRSRSFAASS